MDLAALRSRLLEGLVIPAHPLALTERRTLDERSQRALTRYYIDAGAGGIAVGVHTTQFAIRAPEHGLYEPVLALASETADAWSARPTVKVAGLVGRTPQALAEARVALDLGYHAGLLSLGAWRGEPEEATLEHCREVAAAIPLFGFYLQPAVGGRPLSHAFWRAFAEIERVVAIKIAPFNRYQTLDVVRAVSDAGREDIALYTGNDDSILVDLLTPFPTARRDGSPSRRIVGGLLGHWAVWTHAAARLLEEVKRRRPEERIRVGFLHQAAAVTDMNGALFDVRHDFAGSIPGILEVLRRQRLVRGTWCLDPSETLSPGQSDEIDRVTARYAHLTDDGFVEEGRDRWMSG
ncbi:MAG TPA: dihydrodipicolinate synthase family protein [Gemmatimonadaceae bacterium]|nr:dihydrodipicolinate synthase family protein [Gemmatimonadaceae bacterium]